MATYGKGSRFKEWNWMGPQRGDLRQDVRVMNPMHIITLKAKRPSWGVRLAAKIKSISEQWFSHILLLSILSGYATIGALFFRLIEGGHETEHKQPVRDVKEAVMEELWEFRESSASKEEWLLVAHKRLGEYESAVQSSCANGVYSPSDDTQWTIWGAFFYCGTVFTTIGYGNIAPSTDAGRAATIIYAFLGIPLMLMVLADLGKLFTKAIKFVFRYVRRFYKTGSFRKNKTMAPQNKTLQYMTVSWRTVNQRSSSLHDPHRMQRSGSVMPSTDPSFNQVTSLTLHNDDLYKDLDSANADGEITKHVEVEDEFNLPVSLAVALVLIYMVLGALIFTIWEDWTFFEAFYFVFISMSTVGFGDFVPSHPSYMMAAFLYLVFGLTLTSMCINVIQEKLSATFQKAKVRIGTTIGLDVNTLIDRPRSPKSGLADPRKTNGLGIKATYHHKDSVCGTPSRATSPVPSGEYSCPPSPADMGGGVEGYGGGKEVLINLPLQNRWTFYDSPYNTVHSDSVVPVPSRAGSTISVNKCRL